MDYNYIDGYLSANPLSSSSQIYFILPCYKEVKYTVCVYINNVAIYSLNIYTVWEYM